MSPPRKMGCGWLRAEFQKSKLSYTFQDKRIFFACFWKIPRLVFLLIRVCLALYCLYAFLHYVVNYTAVRHTRQNIMVFFTTWSYIVLTIHMTLAGVLSVVFYKEVNYIPSMNPAMINGFPQYDNRNIPNSQLPTFRSNSQSTESGHSQLEPSRVNGNDFVINNTHSNFPSETNTHLGENRSKDYETNDISQSYVTFSQELSRTPHLPAAKWYFQISWALSDILNCAAPIVTCVFFFALYDKSKPIGIQNTNVHLLNSIFILIDFALSARPVRILHVYPAYIYGACWLIFSVIYWSTDNTDHIVYKFFDWGATGRAIAWTFGLLFVIFVLMWVYYALYRLKIWLYSLIYKEEHFISYFDTHH